MKEKCRICIAVILAFIVGFAFGVLAYAGRTHFAPSDVGVCSDGAEPDKYGCCPGEIYTDMADLGYNCCPETGGDCFPPLR